jgi:hypothetical protein
MSRAQVRALLFAVLVGLLAAQGAHAQPDDAQPGQVIREEPDPTRLDVSRLPPEVAEITRELYAQGFFVEAQLGAQGFVGDLGAVAAPGPRLAVDFGYELATWISLFAGLEATLHVTKNNAPPSRTAFEMAGALAGLKLSIPFNARSALWLSGVAGLGFTGGDVLKALGFRDAIGALPSYGGELGFDYHVRSRHHSLGLLGGGRLLPALARDGQSLAVYGSLYLRYVF